MELNLLLYRYGKPSRSELLEKIWNDYSDWGWEQEPTMITYVWIICMFPKVGSQWGEGVTVTVTVTAKNIFTGTHNHAIRVLHDSTWNNAYHVHIIPVNCSDCDTGSCSYSYWTSQGEGENFFCRTATTTQKRKERYWLLKKNGLECGNITSSSRANLLRFWELDSNFVSMPWILVVSGTSLVAWFCPLHRIFAIALQSVEQSCVIFLSLRTIFSNHPS